MPGKRAPEDERREQILDAAARIATRSGLAGLATRAVAAEAQVSNGLVFFYFKNRQELLHSLLDWLLDQTILRRAHHRNETSGDLSSEMRQAIEQLPRDRKRLELFFEYWFLSARDSLIRNRIRAALKRYRQSYVPLAKALLEASPTPPAGLTAQGLASLVTDFIEGAALRLIADPKGFDPHSSAAALELLIAGATGR